MTAQESAAIMISFAGVRTPRMFTTPEISGRIVTGLSENR